MFKISHEHPNRIDIEFGGKLNKAQMKVALDEFVSESKNIEHGKMMYRIDGFSLPTLAAIGHELSRLPEVLEVIRKFDRAAVLADMEWVRAASEIEGKLIPGLTIKAFGRSAEIEAEAWLES